MNPKVSILVPIYGVEKFIERCVISLFEQTFDDIEYIFVNDFTPDISIDILKQTLERYPNRKDKVKIIDHKINRGIAVARNTLVENASGDYLLFVDSDDYLELNMIELLYTKASNENLDIVVCDYFLEWSNEIKIVEQSFNSNNELFLKMLLEIRAAPCLWNKLIKKDLYINNNILTVDGINLGEDFMTIPRLVYYSNKIGKINLPLYHYIQLNNNSYTKNYTETSIDNIVFTLNFLDDFFKSKNDYNIYERSLLIAKIKKKLELFEKTDNGNWDKIFDLFPQTLNEEDYSFLNNKEKFFNNLLLKRKINRLKLYMLLYKQIFFIYQKIKKR